MKTIDLSRKFRWQWVLLAIVAPMLLLLGRASAAPVTGAIAQSAGLSWIASNRPSPLAITPLPGLAGSRPPHPLSFSGLQYHDIRPLSDPGGKVMAYVINLSPKGYVVLAADDAIDPILAFSTESSFIPTLGPDDTLSDMLLTDIPARLAHASTLSASARNSIRQEWNRLASGAIFRSLPLDLATQSDSDVNIVVDPILQDGEFPDGNFSWNEGEPYNLDIPDLCETGCVATAMAMIIRHYRYPPNAAGTDLRVMVNGTPETYNIDSSYTFDYDRMPPNFDGANAAIDPGQVATLMFDCGLSVHMDYSTSESGSSVYYVPSALINNFHYSSMAVWKNGSDPDAYSELQSELNNGRPAELEISGPASDHAPVCDGWGTQASSGALLFHLNMGWDGVCNGWYALPIFTAGFEWTSLDGYAEKIQPLAQTTISITSSTNPSQPGQPVTFTATISPVSPAAGTPTGTVILRDGTTVLETQALIDGQVSFSIATLALGIHSITVSYAGDNNFGPVTSTVLNQVVMGTSVTLSSSANPSVSGQRVTFTAVIAAVPSTAGTPIGTVTFLDGAANLGTQILADGMAAFSMMTLTVGSHTITASYSGDTQFNGSTSPMLDQVVNEGTAGGLQPGSPWPAFHQNAVHTGQGGGSGAGGTLKWKFTTGASVDSSPGIGSDGTIYVGSGDGNLYAIDPADGSQKWKFTAGWAITSSPAIGMDGTIYVGSWDNNVYAINPEDGSQKWKFATWYWVESSPTVAADGTIYVGSDDGNLYAIDSADGSQKWKFTTGGEVLSSPAIGSDGTVYVGSEDDYMYAINPADGSQKWKFTTGYWLESSPAVGADGTIYVGSPDYNVYARNPADGSKKWEFTTAANIDSSPAIGSDGTIYVGSEDGNLYAINPTSGSQKWKFTTESYVESSPAIGADGTIYVGSDDNSVYAINPTDGSQKWKFTTGNQVDSSPAIGSDGTIYVGSNDGSLYAIGKPALASVVLTSSQSPAIQGLPITFTATVSGTPPDNGTPTGTVAFLDGTVPLGAQSLVNGVAAFSTSTLSVGSHSITAAYAGDADFNGATSAALTQVVTLRGATVRIASSQNPSSLGQSVTFAATVSAVAPAPGTPTGTVTFPDGTADLGAGPVPLNTYGQVTFSTSALSVGSHTITVSYSGDTSFSAATSTALTQTVNQGSAAVGLISSLNRSLPGQSVTFTATVSPVAPAVGTPTGAVTFLDGTTALGSQPLADGVAILSTSSLKSGSHIITASYSGDSEFETAQASLSQIVASPWLPADVSIGADNLSRVLWANPDGQALLWSLNGTSGNYTQGPVFGPYDGGAWQATRIACGKDGISRVFWNKGDGTLSLWWLNADNTFRKNMLYGPFDGWTATDIAVGSDNLHAGSANLLIGEQVATDDNVTHILWTSATGQALVWSVDSTTGNYTAGITYGPYPGYTAVALACGTDGLTRVLWANPLGMASLWIMDAQNQYQSCTIFGPYAGWIPTDLDVGSDDLARVLWTNTTDGRAIVWSVDANGNPTNNQNFYGPFNGYTAKHVACGSDGFTRLTWVSTSGVLSLWNMAPDNTLLTFNVYGLYE